MTSRDPTGDRVECSIPCNLCGSTDASLLSRRSRSGKPLRTVICRQCGLAWSDPRPHDPREFYAERYRVDYKGACAPKPKHVLRAGKTALSRFAKIRDRLAGVRTILDVGTGGGEFAYLLRSLGYDLKGVEPNRGYADYSVAEYGLDVRVGFVEQCDFAANAFDLITIWHVLEHTENPGGVLAKLLGWLRPGGVLVVEVPSIEATCQSPKSTFHEAHLYHFNVASLRRLAERTGFAEAAHVISEDGGNLTMYLHKRPARAGDAAALAIPGNCKRVAAIVRAHTPLRHYLGAAPYVRTARRLARIISEKREGAGFDHGKAILDRLYSHLTAARPAAVKSAAH